MRRDERPVYVRFVCFQAVQGQRSRLGLFQAIEEAYGSDHAPGWALGLVGEINSWFSKNLPVPDRFQRGRWRRPGQPALSWFKPTASEHIRRMHELKTALEACGIHVEVLTTRVPGVIIYEDEFQITAEPGAGRF
jgi:hypothetical protein